MESKSDMQYTFMRMTDWDRCSECHAKYRSKMYVQNCGDIICLYDECSISFSS